MVDDKVSFRCMGGFWEMCASVDAVYEVYGKGASHPNIEVPVKLEDGMKVACIDVCQGSAVLTGGGGASIAVEGRFQPQYTLPVRADLDGDKVLIRIDDAFEVSPCYGESVARIRAVIQCRCELRPKLSKNSPEPISPEPGRDGYMPQDVAAYLVQRAIDSGEPMTRKELCSAIRLLYERAPEIFQFRDVEKGVGDVYAAYSVFGLQRIFCAPRSVCNGMLRPVGRDIRPLDQPTKNAVNRIV